MCWQLDPTEGPGRVRRRMIRVPRTVSDKHILPEVLKEQSGTVECGELFLDYVYNFKDPSAID